MFQEPTFTLRLFICEWWFFFFSFRNTIIIFFFFFMDRIYSSKTLSVLNWTLLIKLKLFGLSLQQPFQYLVIFKHDNIRIICRESFKVWFFFSPKIGLRHINANKMRACIILLKHFFEGEKYLKLMRFRAKQFFTLIRTF